MNEVPITTLLQFMESVAAHPHSDLDQIAAYASYSRRTAQRALSVLQPLGIIEVDADGRYVSTAKELVRGVDEGTCRQVLRRGLLGYRRFEAILEGLALGEDTKQAVNRAAVSLGLDSRQRQDADYLLRLARELGILALDGAGEHVLCAEIKVSKPPPGSMLSAEQVDSEAKARLFVATQIGRDAYDSLDEVDRKLLADSILHIERDPKEAAGKAGQALENYLREVAADRGLEAKAAKENGAVQLANMLRGEGLILPNHIHWVQGVSAMRNTKGHSKDKVTRSPWLVTPEAAGWALQGALLVIRSVHDYLNDRSQRV